MASDRPTIDPTLVETCLEGVTERYGDGEGGRVTTTSSLPPSVGLKTSSASASATALATLDALGLADAVDRVDLAHLVVEVTREVGVTVTGALDDTAASLLGGLVSADNEAGRIVDRRVLGREVAILVPGEGQPSTAVDVDALRSFAPVGEVALEQLDHDRFGLAMTLNGLAVATALGLDGTPIADGIGLVEGVSVSGTGPAVAAIGADEAVDRLASTWSSAGTVHRTSLREMGATISEDT
ncbi:MAG: shikimate kinase, partial [Halobacteriota archaeon]